MHFLDRENRLNSKDTVIICITYFIAYAFIIFNNGVFWDDWVVTSFNHDSADTIALYKELGFFLNWPAYLHNFIFAFNRAILIERLLIFFSYFGAALFLNSILKNIAEIDSSSRLFIVLIFSLFPVNVARIALCNLHYALCYFTFFLSFWLTTKFIYKKNILFRITALLIFYFSFSISSLLVFYLLVILYILYCEHKKERIQSLLTLILRSLKYIDFLILPITFWFVKNIFFEPYGLYAEYNKITLQNILSIPLKTILSFWYSFLKIVFRKVIIFLSLSFLAFIVILVSYLIRLNIQNKEVKTSKEKIKTDVSLFIFGLISFFIAILPYLAVDKVPVLYDWESRHQLLVPLGSSFILYYGLRLFFNYNYIFTYSSEKIFNKSKFDFAQLMCSLLLVIFIIINIHYYSDYQKDWYKQLSLIENFKSSDVMKKNTTFLFTDKTESLNAMNRTYRFYEYTGLMKYAFGTETRFGINSRDFKYFGGSIKGVSKLFLTSRYNLKDYDPVEPEYETVIHHGEYVKKNNWGIKLLLLNNIDKKKFKKNIKKIVYFEYNKL